MGGMLVMVDVILMPKVVKIQPTVQILLMDLLLTTFAQSAVFAFRNLRVRPILSLNQSRHKRCLLRINLYTFMLSISSRLLEYFVLFILLVYPFTTSGGQIINLIESTVKNIFTLFVHTNFYIFVHIFI